MGGAFLLKNVWLVQPPLLLVLEKFIGSIAVVGQACILVWLAYSYSNYVISSYVPCISSFQCTSEALVFHVIMFMLVWSKQLNTCCYTVLVYNYECTDIKVCKRNICSMTMRQSWVLYIFVTITKCCIFHTNKAAVFWLNISLVYASFLRSWRSYGILETLGFWPPVDMAFVLL